MSASSHVARWASCSLTVDLLYPASTSDIAHSIRLINRTSSANLSQPTAPTTLKSIKFLSASSWEKSQTLDHHLPTNKRSNVNFNHSFKSLSPPKSTAQLRSSNSSQPNVNSNRYCYRHVLGLRDINSPLSKCTTKTSCMCICFTRNKNVSYFTWPRST